MPLNDSELDLPSGLMACTGSFQAAADAFCEQLDSALNAEMFSALPAFQSGTALVQKAWSAMPFYHVNSTHAQRLALIEAALLYATDSYHAAPSICIQPFMLSILRRADHAVYVTEAANRVIMPQMVTRLPGSGTVHVDTTTTSFLEGDRVALQLEMKHAQCIRFLAAGMYDTVLLWLENMLYLAQANRVVTEWQRRTNSVTSVLSVRLRCYLVNHYCAAQQPQQALRALQLSGNQLPVRQQLLVAAALARVGAQQEVELAWQLVQQVCWQLSTSPPGWKDGAGQGVAEVEQQLQDTLMVVLEGALEGDCPAIAESAVSELLHDMSGASDYLWPFGWTAMPSATLNRMLAAVWSKPDICDEALRRRIAGAALEAGAVSISGLADIASKVDFAQHLDVADALIRLGSMVATAASSKSSSSIDQGAHQSSTPTSSINVMYDAVLQQCLEHDQVQYVTEKLPYWLEGGSDSVPAYQPSIAACAALIQKLGPADSLALLGFTVPSICLPATAQNLLLALVQTATSPPDEQRLSAALHVMTCTQNHSCQFEGYVYEQVLAGAAGSTERSSSTAQQLALMALKCLLSSEQWVPSSAVADAVVQLSMQNSSMRSDVNAHSNSQSLEAENMCTLLNSSNASDQVLDVMLSAAARACKGASLAAVDVATAVFKLAVARQAALRGGSVMDLIKVLLGQHLPQQLQRLPSELYTYMADAAAPGETAWQDAFKQLSTIQRQKLAVQLAGHTTSFHLALGVSQDKDTVQHVLATVSEAAEAKDLGPGVLQASEQLKVQQMFEQLISASLALHDAQLLRSCLEAAYQQEPAGVELAVILTALDTGSGGPSKQRVVAAASLLAQAGMMAAVQQLLSFLCAQDVHALTEEAWSGVLHACAAGCSCSDSETAALLALCTQASGAYPSPRFYLEVLVEILPRSSSVSVASWLQLVQGPSANYEWLDPYGSAQHYVKFISALGNFAEGHDHHTAAKDHVEKPAAAAAAAAAAGHGLQAAVVQEMQPFIGGMCKLSSEEWQINWANQLKNMAAAVIAARACLEYAMPEVALEVYRAAKSNTTSKDGSMALPQLREIALVAAVQMKDFKLGHSLLSAVLEDQAHAHSHGKRHKGMAIRAPASPNSSSSLARQLVQQQQLELLPLHVAEACVAMVVAEAWEKGQEGQLQAADLELEAQVVDWVTRHQPSIPTVHATDQSAARSSSSAGDGGSRPLSLMGVHAGLDACALVARANPLRARAMVQAACGMTAALEQQAAGQQAHGARLQLPSSRTYMGLLRVHAAAGMWLEAVLLPLQLASRHHGLAVAGQGGSSELHQSSMEALFGAGLQLCNAMGWWQGAVLQLKALLLNLASTLPATTDTAGSAVVMHLHDPALLAALVQLYVSIEGSGSSDGSRQLEDLIGADACLELMAAAEPAGQQGEEEQPEVRAQGIMTQLQLDVSTLLKQLEAASTARADPAAAVDAVEADLKAGFQEWTAAASQEAGGAVSSKGHQAAKVSVHQSAWLVLMGL